MTEELRQLQQEFDRRLPKDSQGLVVPDPTVESRLLGRQKALRKVTAARHAVLKAKMARRAGLKDLPLYVKRGRRKFHSKLRCRVGSRGLKERTAMEEALKASVHRDSVKGDNDGKWVS